MEAEGLIAMFKQPSHVIALSQNNPFYGQGLKVVSFWQVSPLKTLCAHFLFSIYTTCPPISFFLIWSPKEYLVRSSKW